MNSITALAMARAIQADRLQSVNPRTEEEILNDARLATPRRSWTTIVSFPRFQLSKAQPSA
jgi:hypothetical protein